MAKYNNLKSGLDAVIRTNIMRSITGDVLNRQLNAMIDELGHGFQYMGVATPTMNPGTSDSNLVYLASVPGIYPNFGNLEIEAGDIAFFRYDGSWHKDEIKLSIVVDDIPSSGSNNPVKSGGVYAALEGKESSTNKVTTLSPSSNDKQYPSAKCVYDLISGLTEPFNYEIVSSLPTASARTVGTIYVLTGESSSTLYLTTESEGSYSWSPIGEMATSITTISNGDIDSLFD